MNSFGLPQDVYKDIVNILKCFPEIEQAKVFGSRAKGTQKRYSDVDIAIFAKPSNHLSASVKDALESLDVIYNFDVLHFEMTSNADLKDHINRVGVALVLD